MAEHIPDPSKAAADVTANAAEIARKNRALAEEMAHFGRGEMLRFFQQRLDRDTTAIGKLQEAHNVGDFIAVQQEWLRDLFQDYASQNMRLANLMRDLTEDAFARCGEVAGMGRQSARAAANGMADEARKAEEGVEEMTEVPAQMAEEAQQAAQTQH